MNKLAMINSCEINLENLEKENTFFNKNHCEIHAGTMCIILDKIWYLSNMGKAQKFEKGNC